MFDHAVLDLVRAHYLQADVVLLISPIDAEKSGELNRSCVVHAGFLLG
jgi:hypothetical protein